LSRLAEDEEKKEEDEKGAEAEAAKTIQEDKEHAAEAKKADDSADEAIDDDDAKAAEADLAKESSEKTGYDDRLANIENALRSLVPDAFPTKEALQVGTMGDEEAFKMPMDEDEALLDVMLAEEGLSDDLEDMVADPMGVMARELDEKDSEMLAVLFGKDAAEDKAEKEDHDEGAVKDDEEHIADLEEDKDEDEKALKKEEKKAAQKPQPKKASTGAKRLGGVSKEASSEVANLSSLWESAPDVSRFFN
jgi:hypothetical protein